MQRRNKVYDDDDVEMVIKMKNWGFSARRIAFVMSFSNQTVSNILHGNGFKKNQNMVKGKVGRICLPPEKIEKVLELLRTTNLPARKIARRVGVSQGTVFRYLNGKVKRPTKESDFGLKGMDKVRYEKIRNLKMKGI